MKRFLLIASAAFAFMACSTIQASTIYSHNFLGSDSDPLDGVGVEGGTAAGTPWTAEPAWFADGHVIAGVDNTDSANAILPFSPQAGSLYRLSATLTASGDTFNFLTLGFMNNPTVDTLSDQAGGPWLLKRAQQAGFADEVYSALDGTNTANAALALHGAFPGATALSMELDARSAQWTIEFFINGNSVRGPVNFDVGTTPITHVGLSRYVNPVAGTAAEFSLTQVPEPSMLGLMCIGLTIGLAYRVTKPVLARRHINDSSMA